MRSVVLIGIAILFLIGAAQAGDWSIFRHDTSHSGTADEIVEPPLKLLWEFTKGGSIYSSSAVAGGMVYVGSEDFNVYALDAATGAIKWEYPTGGVVRSSPAVSGGMVYVGSYDNNVYALDAATGSFKWEYKTGGIIESSPVVSDGVVYIGSGDFNIYALDAATGALKWKYMVGWFVTSPAVSGGVVYVGSDVNNVYALDATTGALRWKHEIEKDVSRGVVYSSSPVVSDGMVYVIAQVSSPKAWVYALDAVTGALKWKYMTGSYVYSSPAVSDDTVYVGSNDKNLYAFDAKTGALRWKYTGSYGFFSPSVSGDVVYVGSEDGNLYALDAVTGALKWKHKIGFGVSSSPVVSGGMVYVSSYDNIYAFAPGVDGNEIDWTSVGGVILAILLIGIVTMLIRKPKKIILKAVEEPASKDKPPQKGKIAKIILIILLIVAGAIGYTIYQKYSPLAELANCGNNCIDYKKMRAAQYETSVPDIKITEADTDKLIMDVPIIIRNPSTKDTETVKIDFDVSMEGKHLTKGTIPAYKLPAKQNTTILIKDVVIKYEELGEVLQIVAERHGAEMVREGKANISMTIDLLIYFPIEIFDINIYTFTIPIQIESEIPVDMLKQNEEAKRQIEEKLKTALKEVQEKIKGITPTLPTSAPTPSLPTPIATPTPPLPTPTLPGFP